MKRVIRLFFLLLVCQAMAVAHQRPVATYSIVAYDQETGQLGAAVQSHWFCVGCIVIWAEAGKGAVATQSFVDPSYGANGIRLMRAGQPARQALKQLLEKDPNNEVRQVAFVDRRSQAIAFTGCKNIQFAGHKLGMPEAKLLTVGLQSKDKSCTSWWDYGRAYSAQANLMANDTVWPAMAKAFESANGDLAARMLAALEAAQAAGGDIRGRQSAALIVVSGKPTGQPWKDRIFDLRVDDHPEPLKELRRLVTINRAYNHMNAGDLAVEHKDHETALREYAAAEKLVENAPEVHPSRLAEMRFWHAVALVNMNRLEESLPLFAKVFAYDESWRKLTPRLVKSGLLPEAAVTLIVKAIQ